MSVYFLFVLVLCYNPAHCGNRGRRQVHFPLLGNATNSDGCPPRVPCYLSTVGTCVQQEEGGTCPEGKLGRDPPVFDRVETPKTLKGRGLKKLDQKVFRWIGTQSCPSCDRPSCKCLDSFDSLAYMYPDTYHTIQTPVPLPLCDQEDLPWCYVHRNSECCGDNDPSTEYPQVDVSYQACRQPQLIAQERCSKPCRCSSTFIEEGMGGLCTTTFQGDYWCYVDPKACCQLKVKSKQHTNLYWSTEPCSGSASQVKLEDFENRLLDNGDLMCDTDEDCFAVAGKNECTGDRAYCSQDSIFITEDVKDKFKDKGICLAEDHNTCTYQRDFCLNPCNTSTCFSARTNSPGNSASGATFPLSASSMVGVGVASLVGDLVTVSGCPSPVLPCRCGAGGTGCCRPLWGGRNRGLFCPINYPL